MNMKHIISATLIVGVLASFGEISAQDAQDAQSAHTTSDPQAEELLSEISLRASNYLNINAVYTSTLIDLQADMRLDQAGEVWIEGDKYRLVLGDYTIISDGVTVWTVDTEMGECYIDDAEEIAADGMDPAKMFTIWETGFRKVWKGEVTVGGEELVRVDLYPEDEGSSFHTIQVLIDEARLQVAQLTVKGRDGSDVVYLVTSFLTDVEIPSGSFGFDPTAHPGVQLIDNRL
jgi:outer membrane lipoprotein-sorting protein